MIEQELPEPAPRMSPSFATILTMVKMKPCRSQPFPTPPGLGSPQYAKTDAATEAEKGLQLFTLTGNFSGGSCLHRGPRKIFEIHPDLLAARTGAIVICPGGRCLRDVTDRVIGRTGRIEAVIDKDFASGLLPRRYRGRISS